MMTALERYLSGARVLIVDDEIANVRLLEANLEEDGQLQVLGLTDSRLVLEQVDEFAPDIILLDLMMPHLDGFAILRKLREILPPDANLPIIVLTADVSPEVKRRALEAGARDFLTKPFDATELHLRIRNLLELRFLHLSLQQQNSDLNERVLARTADLQSALKDLRETQRQAVQQERLHAFSEMAGGVVHDFNNSLSIILGYVEILLTGKRLDNRQATIDCLKTVLTAAQDASQIVNRLRHFYRPRHEDDQFSPVRLHDLVEEVTKLARPKWEQAQASGRALTMRLELEPVADVLCNPSEMREVMLNLIFNAADAMPGGGELTLRVQAQGDSAILEVSDTGAGMTEEVRTRCLEPFYSTKGEKGTGLGLAMVHGIIRRHEGTLGIVSAPGEGTTFRIELPFGGNSAKKQYREASAQSARPLRVLFAEDDAGLREIIPEHLAADGHSVEVARNGEEALQKLTDCSYDLLVTDLSMPVMNGEALAAAARRQSPELRIIMLTGFGDMMMAQGARLENVDLLLSKPVTHRILADAIAQVSLQERVQSEEPVTTAL